MRCVLIPSACSAVILYKPVCDLYMLSYDLHMLSCDSHMQSCDQSQEESGSLLCISKHWLSLLRNTSHPGESAYFRHVQHTTHSGTNDASIPFLYRSRISVRLCLSARR